MAEPEGPYTDKLRMLLERGETPDCRPKGYPRWRWQRTAEKTVGADGDTLRVWKHELKILRGAIRQGEEYSFRFVADEQNALVVHIFTDAPAPASGALLQLTMYYGACEGFDPGEGLIRLLPTRYAYPATKDGHAKVVTGKLPSASTYVLASPG